MSCLLSSIQLLSDQLIISAAPRTQHSLEGGAACPMLICTLNHFIWKLLIRTSCRFQIGKENKTHCDHPANTIFKGFMRKCSRGSYPSHRKLLWETKQNLSCPLFSSYSPANSGSWHLTLWNSVLSSLPSGSCLLRPLFVMHRNIHIAMTTS